MLHQVRGIDNGPSRDIGGKGIQPVIPFAIRNGYGKEVVQGIFAFGGELIKRHEGAAGDPDAEASREELHDIGSEAGSHLGLELGPVLAPGIDTHVDPNFRILFDESTRRLAGVLHFIGPAP